MDLRSDSEQYQAYEVGTLPFLADRYSMAGSISLCISVCKDRRRNGFGCDHHYSCHCQPCGVELCVCCQCFHDLSGRQNAGGKIAAFCHKSSLGKLLKGYFFLRRSRTCSSDGRDHRRSEPVRRSCVCAWMYYGSAVLRAL